MNDQNELKERVEKAVEHFIRNDSELLNLDAHELSISHRIAVYLEQEFNKPDLNIDCDYNRYFNSTKTMPNGRNIRPDILVHKRDDGSENLLAIEIKKDQTDTEDEEKLKMLTNQNNGFNYNLGVFIYFPEKKPKMIWFCDGKETFL